MASRIKPPCAACDNRDHHIDPFCKKECPLWESYETDKSLEEVDRRRFYAWRSHIDYDGKFKMKR